MKWIAILAVPAAVAFVYRFGYNMGEKDYKKPYVTQYVHKLSPEAHCTIKNLNIIQKPNGFEYTGKSPGCEIRHAVIWTDPINTKTIEFGTMKQFCESVQKALKEAK